MKPVKKVYSHILPVFLGASAVTIFHTIYFEAEEEYVSEELLSHELCHIRQIEELGALKFYWRYFLEYFKYRRMGLSHWPAYERISFEVEAREAEKEVHNSA